MVWRPPYGPNVEVEDLCWAYRRHPMFRLLVGKGCQVNKS